MGYSPQGGKEADMIERVHIQKDMRNHAWYIAK